jgi:glycosyltransferase involved in cell wall biosynthesis
LEKKAATLEGKKLSWKFRLYHAGYRLWEVVRDFKIADVVFVLNSQKRAYLVKEFDLPEEKLYVIPNGVGDHFIKKINGDNFNAEKLFRLLFIGGWTARKGIKILSQIVEVLFSFDERFRLTCAGVIESKEGVLRLFPKRFWGRIEVIPRFENKDLPGMMSHHGVFIFPSLLESFALSMLEAMVAGLIVVSTPVGAAPEVIISGKNGFLVPFNEAEAFIKTIKFIVAQGSLMKEISDNAKAAGMKFTWPNAARIREAIYINNLS